MACEENNEQGRYRDTWKFIHGNQFNRSIAITDDDGVAQDMSHVTSLAAELFLTRDFSGTPFATLSINWQNEDATTGVLEITHAQALVSALTPDQTFAFGRVTLEDASSGPEDYIYADVLFENFSTEAIS